MKKKLKNKTFKKKNIFIQFKLKKKIMAQFKKINFLRNLQKNKSYLSKKIRRNQKNFFKDKKQTNLKVVQKYQNKSFLSSWLRRLGNSLPNSRKANRKKIHIISIRLKKIFHRKIQILESKIRLSACPKQFITLLNGTKSSHSNYSSEK